MKNRPQDPTMHDKKCGNTCQMHPNVKKSKSGRSKNRSLTMQENCVVFTSMLQQMKIKEMGKIAPHVRTDVSLRNKKDACIVEVDKSTRTCLGKTLDKFWIWNWRDKQFIEFWKTVQFHSYDSSNENTRCKSSDGQRMGKNWRRYRMAADKSQKQKNGAKKEGKTVHFASLIDILLSQEIFQKYKGRVVLRGDIVKDDSGSYAVFTEQGSPASQTTAAKEMDIISRLPGCAGQAADAVSACTQSSNGRYLIVIENTKVRMS